MGRCEICGQVNGHAEGCPNSGSDVKRGHEARNNGGEIRCNFCGTLNPAGAKKCISCNATLHGSVAQERIDSIHHKGAERNYRESSSEMRMPTVPESSSDSSDTSGGIHCPECGYPLRPGVNVCPQCHAKKNERKDAPQNDVRHKQPEPLRRLPSEPVWNMNESGFKIGLCDKTGAMGNAKTYTTDDIILGREELAPTDNHISGKHIHITNEGGQWYVEDVSSTHQTYLVVKGKTPIENGDVIVLGNKYFRFETE